jgi:hypothetical protein
VPMPKWYGLQGLIIISMTGQQQQQQQHITL